MSNEDYDFSAKKRPPGRSLLRKSFFDTALLQDRVGGVAGFDLPVHGHVARGDRAVSDVMVALAMAHKMTAGGSQQFSHRLFIFRHFI
jgi:hypothetical protein